MIKVSNRCNKISPIRTPIVRNTAVRLQMPIILIYISLSTEMRKKSKYTISFSPKFFSSVIVMSFCLSDVCLVSAIELKTKTQCLDMIFVRYKLYWWRCSWNLPKSYIPHANFHAHTLSFIVQSVA